MKYSVKRIEREAKDQKKIFAKCLLEKKLVPTQGSNPGHLCCRLILYPLSQQASPLPLGPNPLLVLVQTVIALVPCRQDCALVQLLWKSAGRHLAKLKVTQKLPSWVAILENPLPVCPLVSLFSESRL